MPEVPSSHEQNPVEKYSLTIEQLTPIAVRVAQARAAAHREGDTYFGPVDTTDDGETAVIRAIQQWLPLGATMDEAEALLPQLDQIITEAGGQDAFLAAQAKLRQEREAAQRAAWLSARADREQAPPHTPEVSRADASPTTRQSLGITALKRLLRREE